MIISSNKDIDQYLKKMPYLKLLADIKHNSIGYGHKHSSYVLSE